MLGLFARGVFINPMGTKLYLSTVHDEALCGAFCDRLDDAFRGLERAVDDVPGPAPTPPR